MLQKDNFIDLKIGDEFRYNRSRKHHKVINMFDYDGKTYVVVLGDSDSSHFEIREKNHLCGVYTYYGNPVFKNEAGTIHYEGEAYITSLDLDAPYEDLTTYSMEVSGAGKLENKVTASQTPGA